MWICTNKAFLSIVEPSPADRKLHGDVLLVRARRQGDIEAVFEKLAGKVEKRPERDYLFRAYIPRPTVANVIANSISAIQYPNFKDSVKNKLLHDAYARIWSVMAALQPTRPYSGRVNSRQGSIL